MYSAEHWAFITNYDTAVICELSYFFHLLEHVHLEANT